MLLLGLTAVTFMPQSRRAVSHLRRGASGSPSAQHRLDAETQGRTPAPSTEVQGSEATVAPQAAEKRKGGFPATLLTCSISAELDGTPRPIGTDGFREAGVSGRDTCLSARGSGSPPPAGMPGTEGNGTHPLPGDSCARETPRTSQISAGCKPRGHPRTAEEIGKRWKGQLGTGEKQAHGEEGS